MAELTDGNILFKLKDKVLFKGRSKATMKDASNKIVFKRNSSI